MKPTLCFLITGMLLALNGTSQTRDYSQWLKTITIDGKKITTLRVPETNFRPPMFGFVAFVQELLDKLPDYYKISLTSASFNLKKDIETDCQQIEKEDASFPVHYYREELKVFIDLREADIQKEEDEKNARIARQKEYEDSLYLEKLKDGYAWINRDSINMRSKPDAKAPIIGQLFRLSYVKAYEVDNKSDWVEIDIGEYTGYILKKFLALDWDELEPTQEDIDKLRSGQHYYFIPNAAYAAQLKRAAAVEQARAMSTYNSAPRRKYYTGPRGGCYFINSNGNKEYVDRKYCQ